MNEAPRQYETVINIPFVVLDFGCPMIIFDNMDDVQKEINITTLKGAKLSTAQLNPYMIESIVNIKTRLISV
ncbi:MAG TPA: hypothetical protein VGH64_16690 [Puia sp.]